jgi:hypothetical protein
MQNVFRVIQPVVSLFVYAVAIVIACIHANAAEPDAKDVRSFALREYLGQSWSNEVVWFPLDRSISGEHSAYRLSDEQGKDVLFQFVAATNGGRSIAIMADLPAFSERKYRLEDGASRPPPATGLRVAQEKTLIRIENSLTGIEVPTAQGAYTNGPFLRFKLQSGNWIGDSRLLCKAVIESYDARLVASGPVYAEIECRYRFAGGKNGG